MLDTRVCSTTGTTYISSIFAAKMPNNVVGDDLHVLVRLRSASNSVGIIEPNTIHTGDSEVPDSKIIVIERKRLDLERIRQNQGLHEL